LAATCLLTQVTLRNGLSGGVAGINGKHLDGRDRLGGRRMFVVIFDHLGWD
jgi:hypothetical protein